jgi:hypothetical protein
VGTATWRVDLGEELARTITTYSQVVVKGEVFEK